MRLLIRLIAVMVVSSATCGMEIESLLNLSLNCVIKNQSKLEHVMKKYPMLHTIFLERYEKQKVDYLQYARLTCALDIESETEKIAKRLLTYMWSKDKTCDQELLSLVKQENLYVTKITADTFLLNQLAKLPANLRDVFWRFYNNR